MSAVSMRTTTVKYQTKPQAAVQYEIALLSGALMYNPNQSGPIQGRLEWRVYKIEGDQRLPMSNKQKGMACRCGYSDAPGNNPGINTTDNVTFNDNGAAQVAYNSDSTKQFTIVYGSIAGNVFTQLARLDVPVNVIGKDAAVVASIDFDNNNATILYNSIKGTYVTESYPVSNISVVEDGKDISHTAKIYVEAHGLFARVKGRGSNIPLTDGANVTLATGKGGIVSVTVESVDSTGYVLASYTDSAGVTHTTRFNVSRSVGRYAAEIITTPTQISYNQTTGIASSSTITATLNVIDIYGNRTPNASFSSLGAMEWRYVGDDWTRPKGQSIEKLEITNPNFTKNGVEFRFIDGSGNQLDYETVPFSSVTNGGDAFLVNVASMNVAVVLTSISYGAPTGDATNVVYMTKNNAVLHSGVEYNVPGKDGGKYTLAANGDKASLSYNGWVFNYLYLNGQLASALVRVEENSPTSVHIPIDVIYPTDNITRTVMISYSAIQKGPAGRSYKPNTPELYDPTKTYKWTDEYRDFIYYAFKVNDKGEQDDKNGVLSYFQYGVKEYNNNGSVTDPPTAKGGDNNWEYVSEYKSIIVNCLFGTNAIIGGFLMTDRTATASNGDCGLVLDGNEGSITSVGENSKTVLVGGLMTIFNNINGTWRKNIEFGIKNGYAVMSYYDNNGNLLYDLGPSGLTGSSLEESKFEEIKIKKTGIIWASAKLDQQGNWNNSNVGTTYNKIDDSYDSVIFGGGTGSIPYNRLSTVSTSVYRYTAARINGTAVAEPSLGLSTPAMAEKADGMYFTSKTELGNSSGSLVNLASGIYGVTSDRQVTQSLRSLTEEYVPKYQVLFNSFLNGKQGTIKVSSKSVVKVSLGADGMVPID